MDCSRTTGRTADLSAGHAVNRGPGPAGLTNATGATGPVRGASASAALGWSLLNTGIAKLGTLGIGIVLARLLGPESYGTFAVAMVALLAVLTFNELGVSLAIVRWPGDPRAIAPTVTTLSIASSTLFCVAGLAAAPWFAGVMGDPGATDVVRVMVCCVLVSGVVATPAALMQRSFDQKTKMVIDQVNVWVGAIVSVVLVLAGLGAMSLAIGRLAGSIISGVFFVIKSPLPLRAGWDRKVVLPLLRFGLPLAGASIVVFCVSYLDQLVTGSLLGPTMLGLYVLAFNLSSWPVTVFSQPLRSVAPAVFARLQHDPGSLRAAMRAMIGVLASITFPMVALLAAASGPIVGFVYGEAWVAAADALFWLAILAGFRILFELIYDYLVVVGMTGSIMSTQLCWLAALVPALLLGARGGIEGVAMAQLLVVTAVVLPIYLWRLSVAGIGPLKVARQLFLPSVGSALLVLGAGLLSDGRLPAWIALLIASAATMVLMSGLLWLRREDVAALRLLGRRGSLDQH